MNKTQIVSSERKESTDNLNLTLKLNTLVDDIGADKIAQLNQKSPEFPKDPSERLFSSTRLSRMEISNPDLHSQEVKEYKIKVTPPKDERDLSERKLSTGKLEFNRQETGRSEARPDLSKKKSTISDQQREYSVKDSKSVTVTPRKLIDKPEKDLSVYNESNHAPKHRRATDTKRIIVCNPQKRMSYSPVKPR